MIIPNDIFRLILINTYDIKLIKAYNLFSHNECLNLSIICLKYNTRNDLIKSRTLFINCVKHIKRYDIDVFLELVDNDIQNDITKRFVYIDLYNNIVSFNDYNVRKMRYYFDSNDYYNIFSIILGIYIKKNNKSLLTEKKFNRIIDNIDYSKINNETLVLILISGYKKLENLRGRLIKHNRQNLIITLNTFLNFTGHEKQWSTDNPRYMNLFAKCLFCYRQVYYINMKYNTFICSYHPKCKDCKKLSKEVCNKCGDCNICCVCKENFYSECKICGKEYEKKNMFQLKGNMWECKNC